MGLRLLHLEDNDDDIKLVRASLSRAGVECEIQAVGSGPAYRAALQHCDFDAVLSDSSVLGYDGSEALADARERFPEIPFIVVSARAADQQVAATDTISAQVPKSELHLLATALRQVARKDPAALARQPSSAERMQQLVLVIQRLSLARDLPTIMDIVQRAARSLVNADGASFVLRDGDLCFYAQEDAIAPLWKGQRFPLTSCISGWAMLNRKAAVISDVYLDSRIPHDAYRPTFVKSLVMTPIRTVAPVGAIGVYWAKTHHATAEETELLKALADSTSIAIEAADVFANLERKVAERTAEVALRDNELVVLNKELEAFSYSVAHDLRSPLITIDGFAQVLMENTAGMLDEPNRQHFERIIVAARRMHRLINDLLSLSKIVRAPLNAQTVDLTGLAHEILRKLCGGSPTRIAEFIVGEGLVAHGDPGLLRVALENLLSNAWKFTGRQSRAQIEFGCAPDPTRGGNTVYFVRDNGAGFDPRYASKLFSPFQRLHPESQFPGPALDLPPCSGLFTGMGERFGRSPPSTPALRFILRWLGER